MRTYEYCCVLAAGLLLAAPNTLFASTLHGACPGQCIDNKTNSPTTANPLTAFDFTLAGSGPTGDFLLEILIPDNEITSPATTTFTITGAKSGTATLENSVDWTSGDLATFIGISASPRNPIGAFLPATDLLDHDANGFYVFQADLGNYTPGTTLDLVMPLPLASYVLAFMNQGTTSNPSWIATPNSAAIFETGTTTKENVAPEPSYGLWVGVALVVAAVAGRRVTAPLPVGIADFLR